MKKLTITLLTGTLLAGGLGLTVPALAERSDMGGCWKQGHAMQHGHGHRFGDGSRIERMMEHLDVNEDQRTQVETIVDNTRPQLQAVREKKQETRKQIRELVHSGNYDEVAISALADEQAANVKSKIMLRTRMMSEILAVLTDEQRAQLEQFKRMRGKHRFFIELLFMQTLF